MIWIQFTLHSVIALALLATLAKRRSYFTFAVYFIGYLFTVVLIPFTGVIASLDFQLQFNNLCGGADNAFFLSNVFAVVVSGFLIISAIALISSVDEIFASIEIKVLHFTYNVKYLICEFTQCVSKCTANIRTPLLRLNC